VGRGSCFPIFCFGSAWWGRGGGYVGAIEEGRKGKGNTPKNEKDRSRQVEERKRGMRKRRGGEDRGEVRDGGWVRRVVG